LFNILYYFYYYLKGKIIIKKRIKLREEMDNTLKLLQQKVKLKVLPNVKLKLLWKTYILFKLYYQVVDLEVNLIEFIFVKIIIVLVNMVIAEQQIHIAENIVKQIKEYVGKYSYFNKYIFILYKIQ